ncbi:DUF4830 domain-containing protein [bacterium]|nr:MAG: DUF4830 domain-containing protein [bacterium]
MAIRGFVAVLLLLVAAAFLLTACFERNIGGEAPSDRAAPSTLTPAFTVDEVVRMQEWATTGMPTSREVTLPAEFTSDRDWAVLQATSLLYSGYDLQPHAGKRAQLLEYTFASASGTSPTGMLLVVCEGKVVGGYVYDDVRDEFLWLRLNQTSTVNP